MNKMTISILGTKYTVHVRTEESDETLKQCDGYCDHTNHEIVLRDHSVREPGDVSDLQAYEHRVLRHEIIHAFLFESGLGADATYSQERETHPEMLVDWFARQAPKIYKAYQAAGIID